MPIVCVHYIYTLVVMRRTHPQTMTLTMAASFSSLSHSPLSVSLLVFVLSSAFLAFAPSSEAAGRGRGHGSSSVASVISEDFYKSMFLHKDDTACPASGFYPYSAFVQAARSFSEFGAAGSPDVRRREIAAFLAQISHETTGGWPTAPDGPYSWGLCYKEEINPQSNYCDSTNTEWPCYPNKTYHGRGPIQLSWNFNYGPAGQALGFDGLKNPEIVANDSAIAFKTALWFWMTPRPPKPSCHQVMVGQYRPTRADRRANRTAGFGLVTNIVNGGLECGRPDDARVNNRIGFYKRYAQLLNVDVGSNLDCAYQKSY